MNLIPGDIVRLRWPHTNYTKSKSRPALVLEVPDAQNDVQLCMITTANHHDLCIAISPSDYTGEATLEKSSWLRPDRTLKVEASLLQRLVPRLSLQLVSKVQKSSILANTRKFSKLAHSNNLPGDDPARPVFEPGQTIPYAGRVFNEDEVEAAVSATLDFWLTLGPEGAAMEKELAEFMGVKYSLLVNSGSSANLIALSALTTHKLPDHKRIRPGDEIITVAAGFPTTVTPIIQCGAVPVFIDAKTTTGNADCSLLESAYSPGKTKAVMMAHALGNPFELVTVLEFCQKYDLWLIEDNCDALGCTYTLPLEKAKSLGLDHLIKIAEKGNHPIIRVHADENEENRRQAKENEESRKQKTEIEENDSSANASSFQLSAFNSQLFLTAPTGAFGDISTQSFYPPHHLTMGEGGAVNIIRRASLKTYAESFRDWGRDCWCPSGKDDTCCKRFQWQLGELPQGYDHKYIYSHLGYNVKPLDPQAAIGRVQLKRLPEFIEARKRNWEALRRGLHGLEDVIDFALPTHATAWLPPSEENEEIRKRKAEMEENDSSAEASSFQLSAFNSQLSSSAFSWDSSQCRTDCSWFGFKMTIKESAPFTRTELAQELDRNKIGNRMLFGGNLVRQPAFVQLRHDNPDAMRIVDCCNSSIQNSEFKIQNSPLPGADRIMNQTIFLGTFPGLTPEQIQFMVKVIREFVTSKKNSV